MGVMASAKNEIALCAPNKGTSALIALATLAVAITRVQLSRNAGTTISHQLSARLVLCLRVNVFIFYVERQRGSWPPLAQRLIQ